MTDLYVYVLWGILAILLIIIIATTIRIVPQSKAYVVERIGAYNRTCNVGLHILIPFLDRVVNKVSLKEHVIGAINADVDPVSIKEAVYQCTPYVGLGKVEDALDVINQVFVSKNIALPLEKQGTVTLDTRFEKGFDVQSEAFGRKNIQANHDNAPAELKHIQNYLSAYCFGDFYTRNGLTLATRELLTVVMLASLGGCENQLRAHVQANLTVGNTRDMLLETITQCQPYIGFPRTLNAIAIINEIANK